MVNLPHHLQGGIVDSDSLSNLNTTYSNASISMDEFMRSKDMEHIPNEILMMTNRDWSKKWMIADEEHLRYDDYLTKIMHSVFLKTRPKREIPQHARGVIVHKPKMVLPIDEKDGDQLPVFRRHGDSDSEEEDAYSDDLGMDYDQIYSTNSMQAKQRGGRSSLPTAPRYSSALATRFKERYTTYADSFTALERMLISFINRVANNEARLVDPDESEKLYGIFNVEECEVLVDIKDLALMLMEVWVLFRPNGYQLSTSEQREVQEEFFAFMVERGHSHLNVHLHANRHIALYAKTMETPDGTIAIETPPDSDEELENPGVRSGSLVTPLPRRELMSIRFNLFSRWFLNIVAKIVHLKNVRTLGVDYTAHYYKDDRNHGRTKDGSYVGEVRDGTSSDDSDGSPPPPSLAKLSSPNRMLRRVSFADNIGNPLVAEVDSKQQDSRDLNTSQPLHGGTEVARTNSFFRAPSFEMSNKSNRPNSSEFEITSTHSIDRFETPLKSPTKVQLMDALEDAREHNEPSRRAVAAAASSRQADTGFFGSNSRQQQRATDYRRTVKPENVNDLSTPGDTVSPFFAGHGTPSLARENSTVPPHLPVQDELQQRAWMSTAIGASQDMDLHDIILSLDHGETTSSSSDENASPKKRN